MSDLQTRLHAEQDRCEALYRRIAWLKAALRDVAEAEMIPTAASAFAFCVFVAVQAIDADGKASLQEGSVSEDGR